MKKLLKNTAIILTLSMVSFLGYTQGVSLSKTRIIFSGGSNIEQISITSDDDKPYLIQSGVTDKIDGSLSSNFIITPPIFRLENKSTSSLRILLKNPGDLPKDKESIFYLNTKVIPSSKKSDFEQDASKLVLVTNFVIKVIYRPESLNRPMDDDFKKVILVEKNNKWFFENPTPYYLTVTNITVGQDKYNKSIMIEPFSQMAIENKNIKTASWFFITDYGELSKEFKYKDVNK